MPINLGNLVRLLETEFKGGKGVQAGREKGAIASLKEAINQFGPGYGSGMEAKMKASATAGAIGSGLGGTTRPAALSAGITGEFEDMRRGRMAGALSNLGNFLGSYRDPYAVSASDLTHAATGGFSGMLQEQQFAEQRRQTEQARLNAEPSLQNWLREEFSPSAFGGGSRSSGGGGGSAWDTTSLSSFGGGGGSYGGTSFGGGQTTGNLLGDFDPAAANLRLGNTLAGNVGGETGEVGGTMPMTGAEGFAAIQNIDRTATGMGLTPTQAMKQFSTYLQFKSWAEGQGMKAGNEAEWRAVKRRIG